MPPKLYLTSDIRLGASTIVTSFRTARELRTILGPDSYHIECDEFCSDEQITVSPDLFDAFNMFITNLSDSHHAV